MYTGLYGVILKLIDWPFYEKYFLVEYIHTVLERGHWRSLVTRNAVHWFWAGTLTYLLKSLYADIVIKIVFIEKYPHLKTKWHTPHYCRPSSIDFMINCLPLPLNRDFDPNVLKVHIYRLFLIKGYFIYSFHHVQ